MKGDEEDASRVAAFAMAGNRQTRLKEYIARGRRFVSCSTAELQQEFVSAYARWGGNPSASQIRIDVEDIDSEYYLRGVEPPYALVKNHLDSAVAHVKAWFETLSEERLQEINDDLNREYDEAHARKN